MVTAFPSLMSNTREVSLPLTASLSAPGPSMSRLFLISSWSLISVMVWPLRLEAKTMVSPSLALLIVSRSEPAPLSRVLVTVRVLGTVRFSRTSSLGRKRLMRSNVRPAFRR